MPVVTDVALQREDTRRTLALEGTLSVDVVYDGIVTDHPVPDRSSISDGVLRRPSRVTIEAIVSPRSSISNPVTREGRLAEVAQFLTECKAGGISLTLFRTGLSSIPLLVIESYSERLDRTDGLGLSISLKGVRLTSTQTVAVAPVGVPRADVAGSLTDPVDTGTGTMSPASTSQSTLAAGLDFGAGLFQ